MDLLLLAPVAVEVEQADVAVLEDAQRGSRRRGQRAGGDGGQPGVRVGPRQVELLLGDGGEVHADRAAADGADDEADGQRHQRVGLLGQRAEPSRDVHVGGVEDAALVEGAQQTLRAQGESRVVRVLDLDRLERHDPAPSRRSESAVTSEAGGCQEKTPAGWPSSSGVSGPHMPRT